MANNTEQPFLTKLRLLGEKYYGNQLYGEHLAYQHELQSLIEAEATRREQALLDEIQQIVVKRGAPDNYYGEVWEWIEHGVELKHHLEGEQ